MGVDAFLPSIAPGWTRIRHVCFSLRLLDIASFKKTKGKTEWLDPGLAPSNRWWLIDTAPMSYLYLQIYCLSRYSISGVTYALVSRLENAGVASEQHCFVRSSSDFEIFFLKLLMVEMMSLWSFRAGHRGTKLGISMKSSDTPVAPQAKEVLHPQ